MALRFTVLGDPGRDNAVFVWVTSGQKISRLLFDCGEGCLAALPIAEVQAIDHLLFSHFHMDHIGGFDSFFRVTFDRTSRPNIIWGPPAAGAGARGAAENAETGFPQAPAAAGAIMQHRFQGFLWNWSHNLFSHWDVHDIYPDHVEVTRYLGNEAFAEAHRLPALPLHTTIISPRDYSVQAFQMDHHTPSMAYLVREKPRINVDAARLAALGLRPDAWLQAVKIPQPDEAPTLEIEGQTYLLADLRRDLLTETPGQSLAYLTDFLLDQQAQQRLASALQGCATIICESQYRHADRELAARNYHMTATQAAELARRANAQRLILFHLSERYTRDEWRGLLDEARAIFPNTSFPDGWLSQSLPANS